MAMAYQMSRTMPLSRRLEQSLHKIRKNVSCNKKIVNRMVYGGGAVAVLLYSIPRAECASEKGLIDTLAESLKNAGEILPLLFLYTI